MIVCSICKIKLKFNLYLILCKYFIHDSIGVNSKLRPNSKLLVLRGRYRVYCCFHCGFKKAKLQPCHQLNGVVRSSESVTESFHPFSQSFDQIILPRTNHYLTPKIITVSFGRICLLAQNLSLSYKDLILIFFLIQHQCGSFLLFFVLFDYFDCIFEKPWRLILWLCKVVFYIAHYVVLVHVTKWKASVL